MTDHRGRVNAVVHPYINKDFGVLTSGITYMFTV